MNMIVSRFLLSMFLLSSLVFAQKAQDIVLKERDIQPYLGIGGLPPSPTLSSQLSLKKGEGFVVLHVVTDSPAHKAGVKAHDVITHVGKHLIGSGYDLACAIADKKLGEKVEIFFLRQAKPSSCVVQLAAKTALIEQGVSARHWLESRAALPQEESKAVVELLGQGRAQKRIALNLSDIEALKNLCEKQWREFGDFSYKSGVLKLEKASSICFFDDKGLLIVKERDDHKFLIVKDKKGQILFTGPYDTKKDKESIPLEISQRLHPFLPFLGKE